MGKFDKFKGKGKSQKSTILKVNKFENKEMVLDLISYISTAEADKSSEEYFAALLDKVNGFDAIQDAAHPDYNWIRRNASNLSFELWCTLTDVIRSLDDNYGSPSVKIAVAGGYSAGKSTFLNYLIGVNDLLPTGIDPVSIVNTHLTVVPGATDFTIRGRNLRNGFVHLDRNVLQSIKHSSKSSVHVASVLKSLHIDCPSKDKRLSNVTFVDTPGYNNSNEKNEENSTTDRATALSQLKHSDAVIWCVDIEKGTIPNDDINLLRDVQEADREKPLIVIFTKRHKKSPTSEQQRIIIKAKEELKKRLRNPSSLYTVCAFSIDFDSPFLCEAGTDFYKFIELCKNRKGVTDYKRFVQGEVSRIIKKAQSKVSELLKELENDRREASKSKSDCFNEMMEQKQNITAFMDVIRHYLNNSYNQQFSSEQKDWMRDEIQEVYDWKINVYERRYESIKEDYKNIGESIGELTQYMEALNRFKSEIEAMFESSYANFIRSLHHGFSASGAHSLDTDIFSAIAAGNMTRFTDCLSYGINLETCNAQKYNPLTYAVSLGRIEMLKYMLENGASADITDGLGHNSFETAVIVHSKAMCELLLKYDTDLRHTKIPLDELIKKNTFENWIKNLV